MADLPDGSPSERKPVERSKTQALPSGRSSFDDSEDDEAEAPPETRGAQRRGSAIIDDIQADVDPVQVATIWIAKAENGSVAWRDDCTRTQMNAYYLKKKLKPLFYLVKYAFLLLAVFETPTYCVSNTSACPGPQHPEMYGSGVHYIPPAAMNWIAICFWLYFLFHLTLRYLARSRLGPWQITATVLVTIGLLDCIVALATHGTGLLFWTSFRLSRLIRPLVFLCFTKPVRETAKRVILSTPMFFDILLALAICVLFFAWIGLVIYADTAEGSAQMFTWASSVSSLWILFTTANCPDVFLPAYDSNSLNFLFFCVFIVISIYLLNNILLAAVYDAYKIQLKEELKTFEDNREFAIDHAFYLLAVEKKGGKGITPEQWALLFTLMCDSSLRGADMEEVEDSANTKYNKMRANDVFMKLDKDKSKLLRKGEFKAVLDVMHHPELYIPRSERPQYSFMAAANLDSFFTRGFTWNDRVVLSWDAFVDCMILIDVLIVFCQTVIFVNGTGAFNYAPLGPDNWWFWVLFGFSCFYVVTLTLKIAIYGIERFWFTNPWHNRFDFFNVYSCFAAEVACLCLGHPTILLRLVLALHITRTLRLFQYIEPLRFIGKLIVRLQPTYFKMGMLLVVVFYVYAMIGVQLYGGLIYEGNPALDGSDFAESAYWKMNFNDFNCAIATLFVLMVVNNWFVIAEALILVSGSRYMGAFFTVSFFIIVNLIVLNILMALILDCSGKVREELDIDVEKDEQEMLRDLLMSDEMEPLERSQTTRPPTASYGT